MDVETLARRLEPLMPRQVRRWMRIHASADPEMRAIIERQLRVTAERVLGDAQTRVLLSLPPQRTVRGAFNLGTVLYERDKWPAGLESGELLQGIGVFGRSGGGKTNAVFHLLLQLSERRIPFLFLDWKRTGRHLIPVLGDRVNVYTPGRSLSPFLFNPFVPPPGFEPEAYAGMIADQLAIAYTLGDGAVGLVQRAIRACYDRGNGSCSLADLIREVEQQTGHARVKGWQVSALRALRSLELSTPTAPTVLSPIPGTSSTAIDASQIGAMPAPAANSAGPAAEVSASILGRMTQSQLVEALLDRSSFVELDALPQGAKRFLIPVLCLWIYHARLAAPDREKLRFVIVVEEAHHVLYAHPRGSHESVMEMLLRQCRELGIAMIVVDQHPHLISSAALGNAYTTIFFNLKDAPDVRRAAAMSHVDDQRYFGLLPVGHAIVRMSDRWRRPFLVRFPRVDVPKGAVSDAALARWLAERAAGSRGVPRDFGGTQGYWARVRRVPRPLRPLHPDELRFIDDVVTSPLDGVKVRYQRQSLSGHRGNAIKERLVREGWLEAEVVPVGRTRKVVLRPSGGAREQLGLPSALTQREGIAHEYWKRHWARQLEDEGYAVRIEAPRIHAPGSADVVGTKGDASIAVEVETGKADVVANVRHGLRAGYTRIVVAGTDRAALTAVEGALARAGLLVRGRVEVVPAWAPWAPSSAHAG